MMETDGLVPKWEFARVGLWQKEERILGGKLEGQTQTSVSQ
jgi:hypothetical protein